MSAYVLGCPYCARQLAIGGEAALAAMFALSVEHLQAHEAHEERLRRLTLCPPGCPICAAAREAAPTLPDRAAHGERT